MGKPLLPPDPEKQAAIVAELRTHGKEWKGAQAVGVRNKDVKHWREVDPDFDEACNTAKQEWLDEIEDQLTRRVKEEKGMAGVVSALAILKGERPEKWSERHIVQHSSEFDETAKAMQDFFGALKARNVIAHEPPVLLPEPIEMETP